MEDERGNVIPDEFSHLGTAEQYCKRTFKEMKEMNKSIKVSVIFLLLITS